MLYDEERLYVPAAQIRSYKLLEEPRRAYFRTMWKAFCSFQLVIFSFQARLAMRLYAKKSQISSSELYSEYTESSLTNITK